ncbi:S66 peptidase family protein [Pedobacter jejuensis]|uniref:LD-carboxypeptidase n=1 Tax=Pedobacter jejuensis TaxID=1268550 RepID=A0A3N0BTF1_9SPHI|nr:LD-carboxypeptidase [Pedobacter jejuensis]RNL52369.1 LD-carboxypeptidase [Pedobacter jejuensis]
MNRKHFLSSFIAAATVLPTFKSLAHSVEDEQFSFKIPSYLNPGDTIGITSPAGYITLEQVQPSILQMQNWGFNIKIGSTIGKRDFTYGGTDTERLNDFQEMLDDPNIKAIMCARGGYGFVRIIEQLDFTAFKRNPKWIIGFSDITVLHCHLAKNYRIASIHSKMCNSFPDDWSKAEPIQIETILSIKNALVGEQMIYSAPSNIYNRIGKANGVLVGGNLSIIETLAGSDSDLDTKNKILFIEDTGEYLYSIDRMLWNLKRSGKLKNLKGLIVGGFKVKLDDVGEEFGKSIYDIVLEKVSTYNYPIAFDFPVGHQRNNFALKCGVSHNLEVGASGTTLTEV